MNAGTTDALGAENAAAPEAEAPPSAVATVADNRAADAISQSISGWPADWREKLAGDDQRALAQLKRHGSPADLWKKARSLEQKLSSGEYRRELAKDATPDELAAWRRQRGIPDAPEGYRIELPDGLVLGEADKLVVDAFTQAVHGKNWDNAKVNEALGWYYAEQERQLAARAEADGAFKQQAESELREEFGADYAPNLNAVKNLLASLPQGAAENFLAGRMADGRRIGDSPGIVRWLAQLAREVNPVATLVPAGGGGGRSGAGRIAEIEKLTHTPDLVFIYPGAV